MAVEYLTTVVEDAFQAFLTDPSYVAEMAEQAATIQQRRETRSVRAEVTRAVAEARTHYSNNGKACAKVCGTKTLCGFGRCAYATPEFKRVKALTEQDAVKALSSLLGLERG